MLICRGVDNVNCLSIYCNGGWGGRILFVTFHYILIIIMYISFQRRRIINIIVIVIIIIVQTGDNDTSIISTVMIRVSYRR